MIGFIMLLLGTFMFGFTVATYYWTHPKRNKHDIYTEENTYELERQTLEKL